MIEATARAVPNPNPPPRESQYRLARIGDGVAIARLQDIANEGQLSSVAWASDARAWSEVGASEIERGTSEMALANTLVAERDAAVVGILNFVRNEPEALGDVEEPVAAPFIALRRALGRSIYLRAMAVAEEARGLGIATIMLDLAQTVAEREGLPLGVIVHESNRRLITHYRERGYADVATEAVRAHASYPVGSMLVAMRRDAA